MDGKIIRRLYNNLTLQIRQLAYVHSFCSTFSTSPGLLILVSSCLEPLLLKVSKTLEKNTNIIQECIVIVPDSCSALLLAPGSAAGRFLYSGEKIKMI